MNLANRDAKVVWHPYTQVKLEGLPLAITHGKGSVIWDEDGKEYIDAISSWWVNLHGHAHPHISKCLKDQLDKLHQVVFAGLTHQPAVELAEKLQKILPEPGSRIFYSDDGSTAVEVALKMAIQYWDNLGKPRRRIIALEGAYHGDTFGAMSVSESETFREPFSQFLFQVTYIPRPILENSQGVKEALAKELSKGDVAAFIFEPLLQGASGMNLNDAEVLSDLIGLCIEAEVITIADEVFTGFGRTGRLFASDNLDFKPEIYCLSKGLTGGSLPLGVTSAPQYIFDEFIADERNKMFLHGHSYTANPLACTAGLANLELLLADECSTQRIELERWHASFVQELKSHPKVLNPRYIGTILAFEIDSGKSQSYLNPIRDVLYNFYIKSGVILRPLGNTVYIVPPYCTTKPQMEKIYTTILQSLELV